METEKAMHFIARVIQTMPEQNQKLWGTLVKEHQRLAKAEGDLEPKQHEGQACFMLDDTAVKELRKSPNLNKGLTIFSRAYEAHKGQLEAKAQGEKSVKASTSAKKSVASSDEEKPKSAKA